jgi:DNA repair exonuclease SbcCD ATPase subunit
MDFIILITFLTGAGYSIYKNFQYNKEIKSLREESKNLMEELVALEESKLTYSQELHNEIRVLTKENEELKKDFGDAVQELQILHDQREQLIQTKIEEAKVPLYKQYTENLANQETYHKNLIKELEEQHIRFMEDKNLVIKDLISKNGELKGINYQLEQFKQETIKTLSAKNIDIAMLEWKLLMEKQRNQKLASEIENLKGKDQKMYSTLEESDSLTFLALPFISWSITLIIYFGIYWWNYGPLLALDLQRSWREQFGFKKKD